jgi:hypothetical protein
VRPAPIGHETRNTGHGCLKSKAKSGNELERITVRMTGIEPLDQLGRLRVLVHWAVLSQVGGVPA